MTQQERRGWVIVVSLFAVLLLVAGDEHKANRGFIVAPRETALPRGSIVE